MDPTFVRAESPESDNLRPQLGQHLNSGDRRCPHPGQKFIELAMISIG